jgi:CSLREA domain-containing protein
VIKPSLPRLFGPLLVALASLASAGAARANTIPVNDLADPPMANDTKCQLREAIKAATTRTAVDACPGGNGDDTITLIAGTYNLRSEIQVPSFNGQHTYISLVGKGYSNTTLNTQNMPFDASLFVINASVTMDIHSVTIGSTDSSAPGHARALFINQGGMGSLINAKITNITVGGSVGCVWSKGKFYASYAAITNCRAGFSAGAILTEPGGDAYLQFSTIDGKNTPGGDRNAEHSAGIDNKGNLTLFSTTIMNLTSGVGGAAIVNGGTATIWGSTIANNNVNESRTAGAIWNDGTMDLLATVVINNTNSGSSKGTGAGVNCSGSRSIRSQGHNMLGTSTTNRCPGADSAQGDFLGVTASLATTASSLGGVGQVLMPATSAAVGAQFSTEGKMPNPDPNNFCFGQDQRGIMRGRRTGVCDIGAVAHSDALLVVANASALTSNESKILERLQTFGYRVLTKGQSQSPGSFTAGKSLVVISSNVTPSTIGTAFRDTTAAVLVMHNGLLPTMKMTNGTSGTDFGTTGTQTKVDFSASMLATRPFTWLPHTGTLSSPLTVTGTSQTFGWGKPITGSEDPSDRPANINASTTKFGVFYYPGENALAGGFINPGPRGFFGLGAVNSLNSAGLRLFEETLLITDSY